MRSKWQLVPIVVRKMKSKWQLVPIIVLLALLVAEAYWYIPYTHPDSGKMHILDISSNANGAVTIKYELSASLPLDATVVVTPVQQEPQDLPVYIYYDEDYPVAGTFWNVTRMLWEHVKTDLALRTYTAEVRLVNAAELEAIFLSKSYGIVIMASGNFPSNVFSWEKNLAKPWLDAGGTLIWFGWVAGYYTVDKGQEEPVAWGMPNQLMEEGVKRMGLDSFFEIKAIWEHPISAESHSPLSESLDITYSLIQQAPLINKVVAAGGLILGKIGGETGKLRSSVSVIPIGSGRIIVFGFFPMGGHVANGPELCAQEVAQILCSGVLDSGSPSNIWHQSYHLSHSETKIDTCTIHLDKNTVGVVVYGYYATDSSGLLFYREFVTLKGR